MKIPKARIRAKGDVNMVCGCKETVNDKGKLKLIACTEHKKSGYRPPAKEPRVVNMISLPLSKYNKPWSLYCTDNEVCCTHKGQDYYKKPCQNKRHPHKLKGFYHITLLSHFIPNVFADEWREWFNLKQIDYLSASVTTLEHNQIKKSLFASRRLMKSYLKGDTDVWNQLIWNPQLNEWNDDLTAGNLLNIAEMAVNKFTSAVNDKELFNQQEFEDLVSEVMCIYLEDIQTSAKTANIKPLFAIYNITRDKVLRKWRASKLEARLSNIPMSIIRDAENYIGYDDEGNSLANPSDILEYSALSNDYINIPDALHNKFVEGKLELELYISAIDKGMLPIIDVVKNSIDTVIQTTGITVSSKQRVKIINALSGANKGIKGTRNTKAHIKRFQNKLSPYMDLPEVVALITIIQNQMSINNINKLEDEIHLHKVSNIS
jgi:hypothetical protein